jgi:hypothetical protein
MYWSSGGGGGGCEAPAATDGWTGLASSYVCTPVRIQVTVYPTF